MTVKLGLTPDQDDENGLDTWQWVLDNNAHFSSGGLYHVHAKYGFGETALQIPFPGHEEPLCRKTYRPVDG